MMTTNVSLLWLEANGRQQRCRYSAKSPLPGAKALQGRFQIFGAEVRPHAVSEIQLGIGALPEEKVAQPLFASGPQQQVDVGSRGTSMIGVEKRLSDFPLWECTYAELYFTDRMWPDFCAEDLEAALQSF